MLTVGQAMGVREERLFVGRERELAAFHRWLRSTPDEPEILNVSGLGGAGKSSLLRAFRRIAEQHGRPVLLVDGRAVRATPDDLLRALGGTRIEDVLRRLNAARPLLLLDTFESMGDLTRYLQQALLPRLELGVRVVIAGRYPLGLAWSRDGLWHTLIRPMPLEGLSHEEARDYLTRRGLRQRAQVEQVLAAVGGHPLALSLAADMVLHFGARAFGARDVTAAPEWRLVVRSLVEQLLQDADEPLLRELLEACAIVRQFDERTLRAVSGRSDLGAAFDRLCRLSVVRPAERGLMLHDDVRRILADDLRWRDRARYDTLRLRALAHYRDQMACAPPAERERLMAERFFLWEHGLVQALLFGEDDPGQIWVEVGRPADQATVEQIWDTWLDAVVAPGVGADYDREQDRPFVRMVAGFPGTRVRIARNRDGQPVACSMILPICRESLKILDDGPPWWSAIVRARWTADELTHLPAAVADARIFYILHTIATSAHQNAALAALLRDVFGLFALGGIYLCTTRLPSYKALLDLCGFEVIPAVAGTPWGDGQPADGFVLDLTRIGFEPWIEAIVAGRRPPTPPADPSPAAALGEDTPPGALSLASLAHLGLSPRETEVLLWIAQGKTDREIAEILVTSRHTIHRHLQNIYVKLGVKTRTAAAARAFQSRSMHGQ